MLDKTKHNLENQKQSHHKSELDLLSLQQEPLVGHLNHKPHPEPERHGHKAHEHQAIPHHIESEPLYLHGIDVSGNNGTINWRKVKNTHIDFAYIKATEGGTFKDSAFARNWSGATSAGIKHGAYHFFRPDKSVKTQIHNFVATVKHWNHGELPPVLDVEEPQRWKHLSHKRSADKVLGWLKGVKKELGVTPVIYMSASFAQDVLGNDKRLAQYPLWLAHYTKHKPDVPEPYQKHTFWQYTEAGKIAGISGAVDKNYFNGTKKQLAKFVKA
jgi:lysozyme